MALVQYYHADSPFSVAFHLGIRFWVKRWQCVGVNAMKNVTYTTPGVPIFVFNSLYLWPSNSSLRKYNQFGNPTSTFRFSEVLKRMLIIKDFVG